MNSFESGLSRLSVLVNSCRVSPQVLQWSHQQLRASFHSLLTSGARGCDHGGKFRVGKETRIWAAWHTLKLLKHKSGDWDIWIQQMPLSAHRNDSDQHITMETMGLMFSFCTPSAQCVINAKNSRALCQVVCMVSIHTSKIFKAIFLDAMLGFTLENGHVIETHVTIFYYPIYIYTIRYN